ncbi:MAG: hypothetical protein H6608_12395 [Flavobacteriales bacterium]|nr:hypothetical protein [Bacteroidota bacterium]MCB9241931.1 hypothetical protein [Flavobacteriales bacterium]
MSIPNTKADILINQLRPKSQYFAIEASSDKILLGENGTQVFIPKNSFINPKGETVKGKVDIELIEILSVADFVKSNLQTLSNGSILQSEGMLFIDAKSNGETVGLAPSKKLQIELPKINSYGIASDIRIFSGTYDSTANINWNEKSKIENKLIPLPLELFEYHYTVSHHFERIANNQGYMGYRSDANWPDDIRDSSTFSNPKLEATFIATREFEERFPFIMSAQEAIGQYTSYYSTTVQSGEMVKDSAITHIYLNNLDKDLWYCDSLAFAYMKTWEGKAKFDSYWYSEFETIDFLDAFKRFYEERLTTVLKFPPGIDLMDKNARNQLEKNGFSEIEIDEIIGAYERQNQIVTARRNKETTKRVLINSFSVSELGWINCDQFYKNPNAKESIIIASISNYDEYDFATMSLIINRRRIALNGTSSDNSEYTFTGKSAPYTRLPIGETATIFALSYKNDKPYIGIKEFVISEKESFKIELVESSIKDINEKLKGIN